MPTSDSKLSLILSLPLGVEGLLLSVKLQTV